MRPTPLPPRSPGIGFWSRAYRLALRLYPRAYRERFGTEMEQVFREQWRRTQQLHSPMTSGVFLLKTTGDLLLTSIQQRLISLKSSLSMKRPLTPMSRLIWSLGAGVPVAGLILAGAILLTLAMPSTYQSRAKVQLRQHAETYDPGMLQAELDLVLSTENLRSVAEKLSLSDRWSETYLGPNGTLHWREIVEILRNKILVRQLRNTLLVDIQVYDRDPQLASDIANALANGYHSLEALGPGLSPAMLVDLARPETRPVGPNIYLNSFIGGLLGVVLGSVTAVVVWLILRRAAKNATRIPTPPSAPAA